MAELNRWGVIYSPKEGSRKTHKRWKKINRYMTEAGIQFDFVQSEGAGSVERLAAMLTRSGYITIIVVGGDAALNDALNGIMRAASPNGTHPTLGVIPNGFGNDFAKYWGFDESKYKDAIDSLSLHRCRKVDVGFADLATDEGESERRYFLNCINVGTAASIIRLRRKSRSFWGMRMPSYLTSAFLLLFQRMDFKMDFSLNAERVRQRVMTLCIGSCRGYGQTSSAVPYNGKLDVSAVSHPQITQLFHGLWLLFTGRFLTHRNVRIWRTTHISFHSTGKARVSLDGHALHQTVHKMEIGILPEEISFLIP